MTLFVLGQILIPIAAMAGDTHKVRRGFLVIIFRLIHFALFTGYTNSNCQAIAPPKQQMVNCLS